jgi:hypothetical protein
MLFKIEISAPPNVVLEYGFGPSIPTKREETFENPPKDRPIILSIFVKNPESIDNFGSVKLIDRYNKTDLSGPIKLDEIRKDLYVSKPFIFPVGKFQIVTYEEYHETFTFFSPTFEVVDPSNY